MKKKVSFAIVIFLVGIALAAFISTKAVKEAYRSRKIEKEIEDLKKEAEKIQNENNQLSQKIAYLQTPEFQEKIAKEKLNLQKPDENVVVVKQAVSQPQEEIPIQNQVEQVAQNIPNYQKWWNLFFKYN